MHSGVQAAQISFLRVMFHDFWKLGVRFSVNSGKVSCETGKVSRETGKVSRETGKVSREQVK